MHTYSKAGEHGMCWLALGAIASMVDTDMERREQWRHGVQMVAYSYGLNQIIKRIVRRPRPQLPGLPQLASPHSQLSFPSAHSTTSFTAARVYRGLVPAPLLYAVAATLGLSRVYLGVHYPTDILAGATLGTIFGEVVR